MSLIDTSKFIEQSRKIYHDSDSNDVSVMLTSILLQSTICHSPSPNPYFYVAMLPTDRG